MNKKFKRALSSILAFAMVLSMMTILNVSTAFAATINTSDGTVLTGNSGAANITPSNCTITANADGYTYTYAVANATLTGLALVNINSSNWKFDKSDSSITFTTDGAFDITLGSTSAKKSMTGITLTKSGAANAVTLTNDDDNGYQKSAKNVEAGKYVITSSDTTSYLPGLVIKVYATETTTYSDGAVTYNVTEGGTIDVTYSNADGETVSVNSGDVITGGTQCTIATKPSIGYYVSSITNNNNAMTLTDGTTSFLVDGAQNINVVFSQYALRTPITESVSIGSSDFAEETIKAATGKLVLGTDYPAVETTYYFTGNGDITYTSMGENKVVRVGSSTTNITFETGDLTGKKATIAVDFASGSTTQSRSLVVESSDGEKIINEADNGPNNDGEGIGTALITSSSAILKSETEYTIKSGGSNLNIGGVTITVEDLKPEYDAANSVITGTDGTIYYVVGVSATNQESKTSYTLSATDTTTGADVASVTDNVVYTGVEVEGTSFTAAEMGFDAYVVAFIIQPNAGETIEVSTLKTKYEMTYSPE